MRRNILLFFIIALVSCGSADNSNKLKSEDFLFGTKIDNLTKDKLIKQLNANKISYQSYYFDSHKKKENDELNNVIETKYFIGRGIDKNKILKVIYDFSQVGYLGNTINIELKIDYYNEIVGELSEKYGKYKIITEDNFTTLKWSTMNESKREYNIFISKTCEDNSGNFYECKDRFNMSIFSYYQY